MNRSDYCYFNGDLVPFGDLYLHVTDLLFQRGYGVFDFFRSRKGSIPWLEDYIERLFTSLELSGIEVDLNREQFSSVIYELQEKTAWLTGHSKLSLAGVTQKTWNRQAARQTW